MGREHAEFERCDLTRRRGDAEESAENTREKVNGNKKRRERGGSGEESVTARRFSSWFSGQSGFSGIQV